MIVGIGIDIIELKRIRLALERNPRFEEKILSETERVNYLTLKSRKRQVEFLAGRFAAKEALGKALGTGLGALRFSDITIANDGLGKPVLRFRTEEGLNSHLSISHSNDYAVAEVILERRDRY